MFENSAQEVYRSKRVKVTGEYKKFHKESLHEFYFSPNIMVKEKKSLYSPGKTLRDLGI
jgi:beta-galactosidase/beta-glucuronidase